MKTILSLAMLALFCLVQAHQPQPSVPQLKPSISHPWDIHAPHVITTTTLPTPSISDSKTSQPLSSTTPSPTQVLASHIDLLKRQGGVAVSNPIVASTVAVQMPTITQYQLGAGPVIIYTQTFAAVPDQWPSASAGSIGLGTIQGTVGIVNSKRAEPTVFRIKGREVSR